ncbi:hypothetical protein BVV20_17000 [Xanthomonas oryzae pv. oryzae]|nr:hypothetical protein BVV20_17000 [Xanthomonas oryzae pv. oryzae]
MLQLRPTHQLEQTHLALRATSALIGQRHGTIEVRGGPGKLQLQHIALAQAQEVAVQMGVFCAPRRCRVRACRDVPDLVGAGEQQCRTSRRAVHRQRLQTRMRPHMRLVFDMHHRRAVVATCVAQGRPECWLQRQRQTVRLGYAQP